MLQSRKMSFQFQTSALNHNCIILIMIKIFDEIARFDDIFKTGNLCPIANYIDTEINFSIFPCPGHLGRSFPNIQNLKTLNGFIINVEKVFDLVRKPSSWPGFDRNLVGLSNIQRWFQFMPQFLLCSSDNVRFYDIAALILQFNFIGLRAARTRSNVQNNGIGLGNRDSFNDWGIRFWRVR